MITLSKFMQEHKGMVYHIGTAAMGGWVMVGTKEDLDKKEHKRYQAEVFFRDNKAEKRKDAIIQLVKEDKLDSAMSKIRALQKSLKNYAKTLKSVPKYADWSKRFVLYSDPLIYAGHIGIVVEGTETGRFWDREEYMNETPLEDKEDE